MTSLSKLGRTLALLVGIASASSAFAAPQFHLAYAVDSWEFVGNNPLNAPNPTYNQIRIRDLHEDHYHNFTINNSTDPDDHVPMPLSVTIGSGFDSSITLGAWNYSPDASVGRYTIPDDGAGAHFHLELISVSNAALNVGIREVGDLTYTGLGVGSDAHLDWGSVFNEIGFSLDTGASLGTYTAVFQVIDEEGLYTTSPTFSIQVTAIPEPSSAAALVGAIALGLVASRRRQRT